MKFLKTHYKDILHAFESNQLTKDDFHFIKKKGRIITQHRNSDQTFSYYFSKNVILNESTGTFEDDNFWEVKVNSSSKIHMKEWTDVLECMNQWLKKLENNSD